MQAMNLEILNSMMGWWSILFRFSMKTLNFATHMCECLWDVF